MTNTGNAIPVFQHNAAAYF